MEHALTGGPDYSIYGLVMGADPVVKGVMLLLVLASVATWAIIFEKMIRLRDSTAPFASWRTKSAR